MTDARPAREAQFAVGARVLYNGAALTVCGVCPCGPTWLYECRPEHEPDAAVQLHTERFLDPANDLQLRTPQPVERIRRRRQVAGRAGQ